MADIPLSSVLGSNRRALYVVTTSNPSLAVPSWAQGGKGIIITTGVGGGGSGAVGDASNAQPGGAGAGGVANRVIIPIASGVTTVNAQVGAAGAAVSSTFAQGNSGGASVLTVGSIILTLQGGVGGNSGGSGGNGGIAYFGSSSDFTLSNTYFNNDTSSSSPFAGARSESTTSVRLSDTAEFYGIQRGASGSQGSTNPLSNFCGGGHSPLGAPGWGFNAPSVANRNGRNATGYGAGGSGGTWHSGPNVTSGAGSPGVWILEFVEGL